MCGISGILKLKSGAVDIDLLHEMIATLAHRGPDGNGVYIDSQVGLAHARLSIIDITGGRQPMSNKNEDLWITFNGEIFNYVELREKLLKKGHRFATRSDTEVILHLYEEYGEDCVHQLNGQWAFAIWDVHRKKLFLSRDRFGVRPLFYTMLDHCFIFASEIKAIFVCPGVKRELDLQGLDQIFTFWVTVAPRTAFKNIFQLPPGHSLTLQGGQVRVRQYWRPEYPSTDDLTLDSPREKAEELLELMSDAARLRLRSDVPVGACLSGGIDSTFVTALARQIAGDELETFSVSFEDPQFDESLYQRQASVFLKTRHHEVRCTHRNIAEAIPSVIWHAEQPILRTAPAPLYVLSKFVQHCGLKVVLTGEGSDEILGGYDIFKEAKVRRFWGHQPNSRLRPLLLKRLYPHMKNIQDQSEAYLRNFFRVTAEDLVSPFFSHLPRWELTSKIKVFFSGAVKSELADYDAYAELRQTLPVSHSNWHTFCQAQYLETMHLLPGYILSTQGDRMAMAHGVEARYPFLDHRVVEFASKLHPSLKMWALNEKYLLKRASRGLLPPAIIRRPKQPYRAPDGECFLDSSSPPPPGVKELLSREQIERDGVFDPDAVALLRSKFHSGRAIGTKDNMALIGILSTQILLKQFLTKDQRLYASNN